MCSIPIASMQWTDSQRREKCGSSHFPFDDAAIDTPDIRRDEHETYCEHPGAWHRNVVARYALSQFH